MAPIEALLALWLLLWTACSRGSTLKVPNIFQQDNDNKHWYSFESEQNFVLLASGDANSNSTSLELDWQVQDHVSLRDELSFSVRTNLKKPERSHILLAHRKQLYYITGANDDERLCQLDLRQDFSTRFPWRYSPNDSKYGRLIGPSFYGLAGLWLNAIRFEASCREEEEEEKVLVCSLEMDRFQSQLELHFDHHKQQLLSGTLTKAHAYHVEFDDVLAKKVEVKFCVKHQEVGEQLPKEVKDQLDGLLDFCQRSLNKDRSSIFPSMMRELGESSHRAYKFTYYVKFFSPDETTKIDDETVTESFSYQHQLQVLKRTARPLSIDSDGKELKFYRLLPLHQRHQTEENKTHTLTYCFHERTKSCEASNEENALVNLSPLMQRKMRFTNVTDNTQTSTGILWGLGPLLMNLAEMKNKAMLETSRIRMVKWRISEPDDRRIWYLYFDEQNSNELVEVDQLREIKLYQMHDEDKREKLQMNLELLDATFEFELENFKEHFRLPPTCPPVDNNYGDKEEAEVTATELPATETAERDDYYDFPQLEQFLNLDRGYVIESNWTLNFDDHREFYRLVERQSFYGDKEEQLFHKIDVFENGDNAKFSLYISYSTGAIIEVQGAECRRLEKVDELPSWMRRLASVSPYLRLNSDAETALDFYGVGGLWRLADNSVSLEFLGSIMETRNNTRFQLSQWRLEDFGDTERRHLGLVVLYTFQLSANVVQLHSIEVSNESGDFGEPKRISIEPINLTTTGARFELPQNCQDQYSSPKHKFPSFLETFGQSPSLSSFTMRYILAVSTSTQSVFQEVTESYDALTGLGQLQMKSSVFESTIQPTTSTIWLAPGSLSVLELETNKTCKEVAQVYDFFQFTPFIESILNGSELEEKSSNFLLANLWNLFGLRYEKKLEQSQDTSFFEPIRAGFRFSQGRKVFTLECIFRDPKNKRSISFVFERNSEIIKWSLESVFLTDDLANSNGELSIHVKSMSEQLEPHTNLKIGLPKVCSDSLYSSKFPQFNSKNLKMRSEITSDLPFDFDSKSQLFLVDEWHLNASETKRYRLQTQNFQSNEQHYLIYDDTDELFDVATEFECQTEKASEIRQVEQGPYLMGPLSLWQAASKAKEVKHVLSEPKLTNMDLMLNNEEKILDWLELSSWQVSDVNDFTYQMDFRRDYELDRVEILMSWDSEPRQVEMRVLWLRDGQVESADLLIPKRHGCERVSSVHLTYQPIRDLLNYDPMRPVRFSYEASLIENGKPSGVRHSGLYARCPAHFDAALLGPIQVNVRRSHRLDGTLVDSKRHVISKEVDGEESTDLQHRLLNEITGECSVWSESSISIQVLNLEFDKSKDLELAISEQLMRLVLTETFNYHMIQKLEDEKGYVQLVYEAQLQNADMSQEIYGPALVTRTFLRSPIDEIAVSKANRFVLHRSATIEVFWPRWNVHLTLSIRNLDPEGCLNIVNEHARPEDCRQSTDLSRLPVVSRQPSLRSFAMILKPTSDKAENHLDKRSFLSLEPQLRNRFLKQMIRYTNYQLVPMQLGHLRMVFDDLMGHLEAEFGLVEPPSPIEYFSKRANMSLNFEKKAIVRLVSSAGACSSWCAELACIALAYCPSTRFCQIVLGVVDAANSTDINKSLIEDLYLTVDSTCSLYHAPAGQLRKPLDKLIPLLMERVVNFGQINKSFDLWKCSNFLSIDLQASEMQEIIGNYELDIRQSAKPDSSNNSYKDSYALVRSSSRLHLPDSKSENERLLMVMESHKGTRAECLMTCGLFDCQLVTYCANDNYCLVLSNLTNYSTYQHLLDNSDTGTKTCSTYSEDFLLNYQHFPKTRPPAGSLKVTANQSLLECAASCDLQTASGCMSFDFCINSSEGSTLCYLQKDHVIMGDFDATILSINASDKSVKGESKIVCSHYSKSLLADFEPHQGQQFKQHKTIVFKNTDLDRCALICRRDNTCLAFEHCHSRTSLEEMQSSCFLRRRQGENAMGDAEVEDELNLETELVKARGCTVYQVKHNRERFEFRRAKDGDQPVIEIVDDDPMAALSELINKMPPHMISLTSLVSSILVGILVGCIFHLGFIRVTGDNLPMFR